MIWFFILHYGLYWNKVHLRGSNWLMSNLVGWYGFFSVQLVGRVFLLLSTLFCLKKTKVMSIFSIMFLWNFPPATVQSI